jgi:hypothetical protein
VRAASAAKSAETAESAATSAATRASACAVLGAILTVGHGRQVFVEDPCADDRQLRGTSGVRYEEHGKRCDEQVTHENSS